MTRAIRAGSLLMTVAASACAPAQQPGAAVAPERKVYRMSRNVVGGEQPTVGSLTLNVERTVEGTTDRYELFMRWTGAARVDVQPGESLVIRADSQEFKFRVLESGIYRDFRCDRGCTYDDRAYYPATAAQVQAIADARRVTVRLVGSKQTMEREFNEVNFERFREFVAKNSPSMEKKAP